MEERVERHREDRNHGFGGPAKREINQMLVFYSRNTVLKIQIRCRAHFA